MQPLKSLVKKTVPRAGLVPLAMAALSLAPDRAHTYEDAAITTPEARQRHFGQADHVRLYGQDVA